MGIEIITIQTKPFYKTCTPPKMAIMGKRYVRQPAGALHFAFRGDGSAGEGLRKGLQVWDE